MGAHLRVQVPPQVDQDERSEVQLHEGANGRSYNRTTYLKHRFAMTQQWADYLDKLRAGAEVILLPQRAA